VQDIGPLQGLSELSQLDLRGTRVSDLTPLAGLGRLSSLALYNTKVSAEQIAALKQTLPDLVILGP